MRKTLISLAMAAAVCQGLTASALAETITLRVTATPSIFKDMFEGFVTAFEAKNPNIKINLDASTRDQNDMIQQILRAAVVGDLPDVSFQGYNYLRLLSDQNLTVPLEPFIAADAKWKSEVTPSVADSGMVNGKVYGLGVGMSFPIIFYNADLVAKAQGGKAEPPDNWDGIIALAGTIQKASPGVLGISVSPNVFLLQGLLGSYGGQMMNMSETELAFSKKPFQDTLQLLKRIGEAGQAKLMMTRDQSRQAFLAGTLAMIVDSSSSLASFEKQAGNFKVATARLPLPAGKDGRVPAAGVASIMLTRDTARQAAAWAFMCFVASPEAQAIVGEKTGYVPANRIAAERPDLLGNKYKNSPNMNASLASISVATSWYAFPGKDAAKIDNLVENAMGEVIALRATPEKAIETINQQVPKLLPNR